MELISIEDVLSSPDNNTEWFCLLSDRGSWTLDTKGIFTLDSRDFDPESNDYLPEQAKNEGWIEVLDGGTIEEIVDNAKIQLNSPSLNDLFRAFVFYYENDAFIVF